MRARRHFQPSLESLPVRLAPSSMVAIVSPSDPLAGSSGSPTATVCPADPASGSAGDPPVSDPTTIGPAGSFTPPATTTLSC
jgi:hypothetical protein